MKETNKLTKKNLILKEFQTIPGVGKSIANDFYLLGFRKLNDIKNKDPERLYEQYCKKVSTNVDKCLLYVFKCAVYYTSNKSHDQKLLLWWNWKNKN
jgi:hypothetical protein